MLWIFFSPTFHCLNLSYSVPYCSQPFYTDHTRPDLLFLWHFIIIRFSLSPRLLACVIPVGQLFGYAIAPLIMTVPLQLCLSKIFSYLYHQRISKKLQYIGATLFMAISLGVLSLSYWAQVLGKYAFDPKLNYLCRPLSLNQSLFRKLGWLLVAWDSHLDMALVGRFQFPSCNLVVCCLLV